MHACRSTLEDPTPSLAEPEAGYAELIGYPSRAEAALLSPTAPACVPQDHLERVLLRHLQDLPTATVHLTTQVEDVVVGDEDVTLVVRRGDGPPRRVVAPRVVAADGAHSRVRELLGIPVRSSGPLGWGVNVLFHAPLWELLGPHRYGIYGTTGTERGATFIPAGSGDRWQTYLELDGPGGPEAVDEAEVVAHIRAGAGVPDLDVRIERLGALVLRTQMSERWSQGRVHLVGDAAHCTSPRGGTGMNTAIAGARDLAWKLGWVERGWAGPDLLDTYERERRPLATHNVARSADPAGTRRAVMGELVVDLGGRIAHAWLPDGTTSTLDLVGPGLTRLVSDDGSVGRTDAPSLAVPVIEHRLPPSTAVAVGLLPGGSVLVRPDGVPVADPVASLAARPVLSLAGAAAR